VFGGKSELITLPDLKNKKDIADIGKKTIDFYKKKGGEVISPLVKAF
jgi:hypothetical protein